MTAATQCEDDVAADDDRPAQRNQETATYCKHPGATTSFWKTVRMTGMDGGAEPQAEAEEARPTMFGVVNCQKINIFACVFKTSPIFDLIRRRRALMLFISPSSTSAES